MLINTTHLKGLVIRARDGEIGTVDEFYFDDQSWTIRYLTVNTGGWLDERRVLISPVAILQTDWAANRLDVALTQSQVENSPDIDTQKPVSRQHEAAYLGYYGYAPYWGGSYLEGGIPLPVGLPYAPLDASSLGVSASEGLDREGRGREGLGSEGLEMETLDSTDEQPADSNLRSSDAVSGYHIEATDGEIGHVEGYVMDDEAWSIRYIEVATRNWFPGKKVLISPAWIERVSWEDSKVVVALSRETIKDAPKYVETMPITREYENQLFATYGRPPYWSQNEEINSSPTVTNHQVPSKDFQKE